MSERSEPTGLSMPRTLILLHGHDDDPDDYLQLAGRIAPDNLTAVVPRGAVDPSGEYRSASWWDSREDGSPNYEQVRAALDQVDAIVEEACGGDGQVILGGFSQGAALALLWSLRKVEDHNPPRPIEGLISIAGWLPTVDDVEIDTTCCRARRALVAHGTSDKIVPPTLGRGAARLLERSGSTVTFIERDVGHIYAPFVEDMRAWITPPR